MLVLGKTIATIHFEFENFACFSVGCFDGSIARIGSKHSGNHCYFRSDTTAIQDQFVESVEAFDNVGTLGKVIDIHLIDWFG